MYLILYLSWRFHTDAMTYPKARANLSKTMRTVFDNHEPMIITKKGDHSVVMISFKDCQALEATAYLLRSPQNARRLMASITQLESGGGSKRELLE